jgi:hypothetical protein
MDARAAAGHADSDVFRLLSEISIASSAFDLPMTEQELDCSQIARATVDQNRLLSHEGVPNLAGAGGTAEAISYGG